MSKPETVVEEAGPVTAPANVNGAPLPPFEPERALATLEWLRQQTPEEQRATLEYWRYALGEAANGESLASEAQPTKSPDPYGASLPPFDPARAIEALRVLRQGDPEEQRETYEHLKKALNEERAAHGERLLFTEESDSLSELAPQPTSLAVQPATPVYLKAAGFWFKPIDIEAARRALAQLDDFDAAEQRETFEYLRQALNEDRAAGGERLLFSEPN